jgi:hypothetical protein
MMHDPPDSRRIHRHDVHGPIGVAEAVRAGRTPVAEPSGLWPSRPARHSGGSASGARPAKPVSGQCHQATSGSSTSQQSQ